MKTPTLLIALLSALAAPAMATTFLVEYTAPSVLSMPVARGPTAPGALPSGLYMQVIDGTISLNNGGGAANFSAGQFGYIPTLQSPPIVVPTNPATQFTPPPVFTSTTASSNASTPTKSNSVDCEVR